jgi:hypothetical protein
VIQDNDSCHLHRYSVGCPIQLIIGLIPNFSLCILAKILNLPALIFFKTLILRKLKSFFEILFFLRSSFSLEFIIPMISFVWLFSNMRYCCCWDDYSLTYHSFRATLSLHKRSYHFCFEFYDIISLLSSLYIYYINCKIK